MVGPEGDGFREQDAHVTALLHMWEDAGLTAESILAAAESGQLSLDFLESPDGSSRHADRTYRQLAEERSMDVESPEGRAAVDGVRRARGGRPGPGPTTP